MENNVMKQLMSRRSVRKFEDRQISEDILRQILAAGQQAPSSVNGQQVSVIAVTDKEKKQKISDASGGSAILAGAAVIFIVVSDFYRVNKAIELTRDEQVVTNSIEGLLTGAIDVGITVTTLATAAESFGLGTTVIGGIRNNLQAIAEICELPEYTIPMLGLIAGYPDMESFSEVKPRLPFEAFAFENTYKISDDYAKIFDAYEAEMDTFREKSGHNSPKYVDAVSMYYGKKNAKLRDTKSFYEKQGYKMK